MSITDKRVLQQATWLPLRRPHRSVCHKHIDLFRPYVPRRNNRGSSRPTALAGITISLTVSQFAHLPSICIPLALSLVSSALRKERQTHFHTNGVRACSPGTRWNCKYFIFAWEPCAITPRPLSPLFHSVSSLTFFLFICSPMCSPPPDAPCSRLPLRLHLSFGRSKSPSSRKTSTVLRPFTTSLRKITLLTWHSRWNLS